MAPAGVLGLVELPAAFAKLKYESVGSPAPWVTSTSSIPSTAPLRHRVLLAALVSLARTLHDSGEQGAILTAALERAQATLDKQRTAAGEAKKEVLESSRAAQAAHKECKRVEGLSAAFKRGADKVVARLDETVVGQFRAGKTVEVDPAFSCVDELVGTLGFDAAEVCIDELDEMDDEWAAIEEDLVATMAARAMEKKSPKIPSSFRLPGERPPSLPPTPPASVHSSEFDLEEDEEEEDATNSPTEQDLVSLLHPVVHPIVVHLYRLSTLLSTRLSTSLSTFESLVSRSASAVEAHRLAVQRLQKTAVKMRDLHELEVREREEEERVMDELQTTVVELAKVALGREDEDEGEEIVEEEEEEDEEEEVVVDLEEDG
ncbi:hypothetical protein JCM11251_001694 [Rhodosporidiobolus azoricus]